MLCAFLNPFVRMAWNAYMHVECQNLVVYKVQRTRKRRILCLKQSIVVHTCTLILFKKWVIYFGTHIYSKGHKYAPWQYERAHVA